MEDLTQEEKWEVDAMTADDKKDDKQIEEELEVFMSDTTLDDDMTKE